MIAFILQQPYHVLIDNLTKTDKSNFEIYAPYVAVGVSLIALFVNYFLTKKQIESNTENVNRQIKENNENITLQIENSQKLVQQTIRANREDLIKDKIIDLEIKKINDFIIIKDEIIQNMYDVMGYNEENYRQKISTLRFLGLRFLEICYRLKMKKDEYFETNQYIENFITTIKNRFEENMSPEDFNKKMSEDISSFIANVVEIVELEIEKIKTHHNTTNTKDGL